MPAYIGVNGKAKGIRKVYKGNSEGKAEMIWGPKGFVRLAKNDIAKVPSPLCACTVCHDYTALDTGNSAIFAGGKDKSNTPISSAVLYNEDLTQTTLDNLICGGAELTAVSYSPYGEGSIFTPGYLADYSSSEYTSKGNQLTMYDYRRTKTKLGEFSNYRYNVGASAFNPIDDKMWTSEDANDSDGVAPQEAAGQKYLVVFAGGVNKTLGKIYNDVESFDESRTKSTLSSLSNKKYYVAGATIGDYLIFGGGIIDDDSFVDADSTVDCYDQYLTRISGPDLKNTNATPSAVTSDTNSLRIKPYDGPDGKYAVFFSSDECLTVNAYDKNLTQTSFTTEPFRRPGAAVSGFQPFLCLSANYLSGYYIVNAWIDDDSTTGSGIYHGIVFDEFLTRCDDICFTPKNGINNPVSLTTIGNYLFFPGYSKSDKPEYSLTDAYYLWE